MELMLPYSEKHRTNMRSLGNGTKARLKFLYSEPGQRLIRIARRVGFRWGVGSWSTFDPSIGHGCGDDIYDFSHEMAHWVVAPPSRKMQPEFGLERITMKNADKEEYKASLLGICYLLQIGSVVEAESAIKSHNWVDRDYNTLEKSLFPMIRDRLISKRIALRFFRAWEYAAVEYDEENKEEINRIARQWKSLL